MAQVPAPEIRDMCVFSTHSLVKDPPFSRLDLISCRNDMIYLDEMLQDRLIRTYDPTLCVHALSEMLSFNAGVIFHRQAGHMTAADCTCVPRRTQHRACRNRAKRQAAPGNFGLRRSVATH